MGGTCQMPAPKVSQQTSELEKQGDHSLNISVLNVVADRRMNAQ